MAEQEVSPASGGCPRCADLSERVSRLTGRIARERLRRLEAERYVDHYADAVLLDRPTSLGTRARLLHDLQVALQRARRQDRPVGVLVADVDGFRSLTRGHHQSEVDALVSQVGRRLTDVVGADGAVARLGGDVFGVLVAQVSGAPGLRRFAEKVVAALAAPFTLGDERVRVTCSIGLRTAAAGEHAEGVLREAEAALFVAKSGMGPRVTLFDAQPSRRSELRSFEVSLREAVRSGAMQAWYQPVLDVRSLTVVGAEALARWQHPERGQIPPAAFIDRAEEAGVVGLLTDHVLELACAQAVRWNSVPGVPPLVVHVNVSGHDLSDPTLEHRVARALEVSRADPGHLCLEITERALVTEAAVAQTSLERLRERGVSFAIDDFGVEYASFAYLRRFPVEILKIDRSFVERVGTDARDRAVLAGMVAMARSLGMRTVAEGVETPEQLEVLRQAGVDEAQGWLFGRARPAGAWPGRPDVAPAT